MDHDYPDRPVQLLERSDLEAEAVKPSFND